jgi:hypothetical protein
MPRNMVGLLAAVATTMSALVAFAHRGLIGVIIMAAAIASGLAAYLALPPVAANPKKRSSPPVNDLQENPDFPSPRDWYLPGGAPRASGLASGLALAVRPAGLAEVSGAQGWVLKIVSAKRLETIFGCP